MNFKFLLLILGLFRTVCQDWIPSNHSAAGILDYAHNPILHATNIGEWILGDPTVLRVNNTIHLWANEIFHGITHYVANASTPYRFIKAERSVWMPGSVRAFAMFNEDKSGILLFYEQYQPPFFEKSHIRFIETTSTINDLSFKWTPSKDVIWPKLDWETQNGARVGNPFVMFHKQSNKWRLFYSASNIFLSDSDIKEPKYIGLYTSVSPYGPWIRASNMPVQINNKGYDTIGFGSIKQFHNITLCNRITLHNGSTGSTISELVEVGNSGLVWRVVRTFIAPTLEQGSWKESYVYGFDLIAYDDHWLIYYNARNGWKSAKETIGVSKYQL